VASRVLDPAVACHGTAHLVADTEWMAAPLAGYLAVDVLLLFVLTPKNQWCDDL
jgi:hypothetical protein